MSDAGTLPRHMTPADRVKAAIGQATASAVSQAKADMRDAVDAAMRQATARAEELIRDAVAKATADAQSAAAEAAAAAARVRADFEAKAAEFEEAFDSFDTLADGEALALPAPDPAAAPALEPRQAAELQAELGDLRAQMVELGNRIDYVATADGVTATQTAVVHGGPRAEGPSVLPEDVEIQYPDQLDEWFNRFADPVTQSGVTHAKIAHTMRELALHPLSFHWVPELDENGKHVVAKVTDENGDEHDVPQYLPELMGGPSHAAIGVASSHLSEDTCISLRYGKNGGRGDDSTPASRSAVSLLWLVAWSLQTQVDQLAGLSRGSTPGEVDEPYDGLAAE